MNPGRRGIVIVGLLCVLVVAGGTAGYGAEAQGSLANPAETAATLPQSSVVPGASEEAAVPWKTLTLVKKMRLATAGAASMTGNVSSEKDAAHPIVEVFAESLMSYKLVDDIVIKDANGAILSSDQLRLPAEVSVRTYTVQSGEVIIQEMAILHELQGATSEWVKRGPE